MSHPVAIFVLMVTKRVKIIFREEQLWNQIDRRVNEGSGNTSQTAVSLVSRPSRIMKDHQ